MPDDLDQVASSASEDVEIADIRVAAQGLLHLQRQSIHALAHVGAADRQPHAHPGRNRDHRRTSACTTAAASSGGVDGGMRKQAAPPNWISIASLLREAMPGPQSVFAVTTTAAKPASPLRSWCSSWRQR